jgi:5-methylcytosine-specific restriction enzyme A
MKAWTRRNEPPRLRGRGAVERRKRVLERFPACVMCRRAASTVADHIVNLARGGADDESNMQGLCESCHALKTQRESLVGRGVLSARFRSVTRW